MSCILIIAGPDQRGASGILDPRSTDPDDYEDYGTASLVKVFADREDAVHWATEFAGKNAVATPAMTPAYAFSLIDATELPITLRVGPPIPPEAAE